MRLLSEKKGAATTEYAFLTLVTVGFLYFLTQILGSNIFSSYLQRVTDSFLNNFIDFIKLMTMY